MRWVPLVLMLGGCSTAQRPQLVVVLDTDMPVIDQLAAHPELSNDAAMDSVHVDVLDATGQMTCYVDLTVADPLDWPVSFGVIPGTSPTVRLRVRLYRSAYAAPSEVNGSLSLAPSAVIDRVVDLTFPTSGTSTVEVVFSGDCLGVLPAFGTSATNCIDATRTSAPSTEGIVELADGTIPASSIGTWAPASEVPCATPGVGPRVCIPGGFSMLGDTNLTGLIDGIGIKVDSSPMRPVILSPFYLDQTEFTVGELDQLLAAQPGVITPLPQPYDGTSPDTEDCTWLGGASGHELYPLNCVVRQTAEQICAMRGGHLPSEAQWEHAARGRGQHRLYPWGDQVASCCAAILGGLGMGCAPTAPEPIESHTMPAACGGIADISRDGVFDLAGSVMEETEDTLASYADPCWQGVGPMRDPVCTTPGGAYIARGGKWDVGLYSALSALRFSGLEAGYFEDMGFRCAYDTGAP
jgi:formylglycine-generating enzyme required for sulfatase activity